MSENILVSIILLSPLFFFIIAISSYFTSTISINFIKTFINAGALFYFVISILTAVLVFNQGLIQSDLLGFYQLGFSFRLDSIAVCMFVMVAFLSFVIIKFSNNYLDGDSRQGLFFGRLAATIASVQLLILSGNIGILFISWILTSICLNKLLIYYPDRILAQIAAHKKFIVARIADIALFIALALLYTTTETGNLEAIFLSIQNQAINEMIPTSIKVAACFLAIAALFKSAQFPTHGWLTEVMETPTPVSALLHAGLLNAGPFLIIRMAFVFETSHYAGALLILVGGITALFASSVYLTQTSVKTALAYSSISHMGFSLFLCGIGLYSAAMLHMVAHSFYKAHAFLSSGNLFENDLNSTRNKKYSTQSLPKIIIAFLTCIGFIIVIILNLKNNYQASNATLILTTIVLLGLSRLLLESILYKHASKAILITVLGIVIIWYSFSYGEWISHLTFINTLPTESKMNWAQLAASIVILLCFSVSVGFQIITPLLQNNKSVSSFYIHLKNGFYTNTIFDKLVGALKTNKHANTNY